MLIIVAFITPKTEFYTICKEKITKIVEVTRTEKGCIRFEVYEDNIIQQLVLVETWTNKAALDGHYAQPYIVPIFEYYKDALAKAPEIHHLTIAS